MSKRKKCYQDIRLGIQGVLKKIRTWKDVRRGMRVYVDESHKQTFFIEFTVSRVEKGRGVRLNKRGWWTNLCRLWVLQSA